MRDFTSWASASRPASSGPGSSIRTSSYSRGAAKTARDYSDSGAVAGYPATALNAAQTPSSRRWEPARLGLVQERESGRLPGWGRRAGWIRAVVPGWEVVPLAGLASREPFAGA